MADGNRRNDPPPAAPGCGTETWTRRERDRSRCREHRAGVRVMTARRSGPRAPVATPSDPHREPALATDPGQVTEEQRQPGDADQAAEEARRRLDEAGRVAEQVRAAAESDAAGIVRRAEEAAERIAGACTEAEADLRAAKDEAGQLRTDLERREV